MAVQLRKKTLEAEQLTKIKTELAAQSRAAFGVVIPEVQVTLDLIEIELKQNDREVQELYKDAIIKPLTRKGVTELRVTAELVPDIKLKEDKKKSLLEILFGPKKEIQEEGERVLNSI